MQVFYEVTPRPTRPFFLPRSIKWVPGISWDLVVKSKLSPRSDSVALQLLNPSIKRGHKAFISFLISPLLSKPGSKWCFLLLKWELWRFLSPWPSDFLYNKFFCCCYLCFSGPILKLRSSKKWCMFLVKSVI